MLNDLFQPTHLLVIGVVLLVFFGGRKLPELGKGLGEGLRGFKEGMKGVTDDVKSDAHIVTPVCDREDYRDQVGPERQQSPTRRPARDAFPAVSGKHPSTPNRRLLS